jgi:hypothetical protein
MLFFLDNDHGKKRGAVRFGFPDRHKNILNGTGIEKEDDL